MAKNEKLLQIYGEGAWVYLNKPDDGFGSPGEYKITLKVPKAKAGTLIRDIEQVITQEGKTNNTNGMVKKKPFKVIGDIVEFKLHSQFKPVLWDKDQNKLDEKIQVWSGSTMWVNCKASGYTKSTGTGATLLLGSVQIDHLVEGTGTKSDTCPFPKRAGSALPGPETIPVPFQTKEERRKI